jgi:hypothetical protein
LFIQITRSDHYLSLPNLGNPSKVWPKNLIETVKQVLNVECEAPSEPEFKFKLSKRAAMKNYMVLGKYDFDLKTAIEAQMTSPLGYGSEFRKWQKMRKILEQ